ncbi:hypothetical protein EDD11_001948 [Mortierella claussenii]|nr:hypothetical protein EDD11_001948 [Mortierella claussenii]
MLINPMEMPEIVSLVGSFISSWKPNERHYNPTKVLYDFCPASLVACCSVSKTWNRCMLPHLWSVYDFEDRIMRRVPEDVLQQNAHLIRHVSDIYIASTAVQSLTRLQSIELHRSSSHLELIARNPDLRAVIYYGYSCDCNPNHLTAIEKDLVALCQALPGAVKELGLHWWIAGISIVLKILAGVSHLERLSLWYNTWLLPDPNAGVGQQPISLSIKHLAIDELTLLSKQLLAKILPCCPQLLKLTVRQAYNLHRDRTNYEHFYMRLKEVIEDLVHHYCPQMLHVVVESTLHSKAEYIHENFTIVKSIGDGNTESDREASGTEVLSPLSSGETTAELVSVIASHIRTCMSWVDSLVSHARTLQNLDLTCRWVWHKDPFGPELLIILGHLTNLRRLRIRCMCGLERRETQGLFKKAWVCRDLESLEIQGMWKIQHYDQRDPICQVDQKRGSECDDVEQRHWRPTERTRWGGPLSELINMRLDSLPKLKNVCLENIVYHQQ